MSKSKLFIVSGIAAVAVLLTVYLLFFNKTNEKVLNAMPEEVICFFDIHNANDFSILLNQNPMFGELEKTQLIGELKQDLNLYASALSTNPELLSDVLNNNLIAGAFAGGKTEVDYLLLLQLKEASRLNLKNFLPVLNNKKPTATPHTFERVTIYELKYPNSDTAFSFAMENGIFIYSTSAVLVENAILQLKKGNPVTENAAFNDVYDKMNTTKGYSFYVNVPQLADYFSMFSTNEKFPAIMKMKTFASWIGVQPEIGPNGITLNGYASASGGEQEFTLAKYHGQYAAEMHEAVPANTVALYRINAEQIAENIAAGLKDEKLNREFFDYWSPWLSENILIGVSESLDEHVDRRTYLILPAKDKKLAESKLKYAVVQDTLQYRGHQLMELNCYAIAGKLSGMQMPEYCYGTWVNQSLVITFDKLQIANMIDAIENGNTLDKDADYANFKKHVSTTFNNAIYVDLSKSTQIVKSFVSDKHIDSVEQNFSLLQLFSQMEFQFTENKDMYLVNGFVTFQSNPTRKGGTLWKIEVDQPIACGPFAVKNHNNGQQNIVVQDTTNMLYMISANGDVVWKRQLQDKIISTIHEVDFYGNNKTQLLFNTSSGIYLFDINGEPVEGFPISLTTKIINPIALVKQGMNDYRMFVGCENGNVYGYYKDGKPVGGWNPQKGAGQISLPIFSFTFQKGLTIGYLNNTAIQLKKENGSSIQTVPLKNPTADIFTTNKLLAVLDNTGNVVTIDSTLKTTNYAADGNWTDMLFSDVDADDTLDVIYQEDDYFKARSISGKGIFVAEALPAIDKLVDITFEGTHYFGYSTLDKQLYLYTATGQIIKGFPVQGSADAVIDDISGNGDKVLITTIGNTVLAYRIL